jgi:lipopolysaccharide biosynthesis glycosyltransferase
MINIYIGVDNDRLIDFFALSNSLIKNSTGLIKIIPLETNKIVEYNRDTSNQSTSFTYSRFLVPYLSNYEGWSIFMDSDFIFLDDVYRLFDFKDDSKDVMVVKHNYTPKHKSKFLNNPQVNYHMKNWSSLMIFNNSKCTTLTSEYVNESSWEDLHQFKWTKNIGEIDRRWNFLVGDYENEDVSALHFTYGTPIYSNITTIYDKYWKRYAKF